MRATPRCISVGFLGVILGSCAWAPSSQRPLLNKGQYLHIANSGKQKRWGLGRYYLLDKKGVIDKNVNIERLARQLGVVLPRKMLEK